MKHWMALAIGCMAHSAWSQVGDSLVAREVELGTVVVETFRASDRTPMAFTNLTKKQLEPLNTGQDLPYALRFTPSLVVTSDAGNGVGYTGLWIRGSDPSRINITINGIPLNDPESQQVFWVNTPDLLSSTENIQVQRGVGTSKNGAASFGGSIHLRTGRNSEEAYTTIQQTYGSFNTWRSNVQFGTGRSDGGFSLEGRLSRIHSDGYIDRASTDLRSWYLAGSLQRERSQLSLIAFGGKERTYQSWYGTPAEKLEGDASAIGDFVARNGWSESEAANLLQSGRTYNYYTYADQVDDYGQDHFQAHYLRRMRGDRMVLNAAVHYTRGAGFFEEFRESEDPAEYGFATDTIGTDLVRRRWLRNHFYGSVVSLAWYGDKANHTAGAAINEYLGEHFGELTWMERPGPVEKDQRYYEGQSRKQDASFYFRSEYSFGEVFDLYADLQFRAVNYRTDGTDNDLREYLVDDELFFFNPKAGLNVRLSQHQRVYVSAAVGSKEPNRNDYVDAAAGVVPKPERMLDGELGYQRTGTSYRYGLNLYWMEYQDQLVLTGELNDVGAPLRTNVDRSFRRGVEMELEWEVAEALLLIGNLTVSENRIRAFEEILYDYTEGYEVREIPYGRTTISFSPPVIATGGLQWTALEKKESEAGLCRSVVVGWTTRHVAAQHLDNTSSSERMLPAYTVSDARLACTFEPGKMTVEATLWVNNVLNSLYSSNGYTYSYIFGERISERFYYPQAGRNFLAGLRLLF